MFKLFEKTAFDASKNVTRTYSTSFTLGIKTLSKEIQNAIYGIYGMVRYADEIVDTFHQFDKEKLLNDFEHETFMAIKNKISLNPILYAYQKVVNTYSIDNELTKSFFNSMRMDLDKKDYSNEAYKEYIYGSAEVVGLMCLHVFVKGNKTLFETLKPGAQSLGAAFQKVNFLRDIKSDIEDRGRVYFPGIDFNCFTEASKKKIEQDIQKDFEKAFLSIKKLPKESRKGVYLAYKYYLALFKKIKRKPSKKIISERIRIPNVNKLFILFKTQLRSYVNVL